MQRHAAVTAARGRVRFDATLREKGCFSELGQPMVRADMRGMPAILTLPELRTGCGPMRRLRNGT
jgi:hypothetical protein